MTQRPFNRRTFIKVSGTTVASLLVGCPDTGTLKRAHADGLGGGSEAVPKDSVSGSSSTSAGRNHPLIRKNGHTREDTSNCVLTSRDITGPYWREGIPIRQNFDVYGHSGHRLALAGTVRDAQCQPIPDAVIEMWHAHPSVIQPGALSRMDSVDYDTSSADFRYYGQFATNERGEYAMFTKKPGWYLNGAQFRPSHIHVRIYVKGTERITTQLYFENDPFIPNDPWASAAPERVLALRTDAQGHLSSGFDFTVSS